MVVSLDEARRIAVEANPDLRAAAEWPRIAQGDARAARALRYNPEATFESRSPGTGFASRYEAQLGLEVEIAGQGGLRSAGADASYNSSVERFEDRARRVLTEVGHAYAALAATERRLAVAAEIGRLNTDLGAAVSTRLVEGEVSQLEANLATIEASRARARVLEVSSELAAATISLARLLGVPQGTRIRTTGSEAEAEHREVEGLESLIGRALASRPDLMALTSDVERARYQARLIRREALPNVRVAGLATREDSDLDTRFGFSLGVSLPLFNRGQGLGDRYRAELAEAEQVRRASEIRVRSEVEEAHARYLSAREQVEILEAELLGPARENQALLDVSYAEGVIDIPTLLVLRNQLLDAELSYWSAWERRERARTDLHAATGQILEGVVLDGRRAR